MLFGIKFIQAVLEELQHALRREAKIYAELVGYGMSADAYHMTAPEPEGMGAITAMRLALDDAGLAPHEIDYINAHGTATQAGDLAEAKSICEVFGERSVPVSSTKALHGHLLGAGGAVELVLSLQSLISRRLPLAAHLTHPDPEIRLSFVDASNRDAPQLKHIMSNAFAFGGTNAVLVASTFTD